MLVFPRVFLHFSLVSFVVSLKHPVVSNHLSRTVCSTTSLFTSSTQESTDTAKTNAMASYSMEELSFDNRNLKSLPIDKSKVLGSRQVPNAIFSLVDPTPVKKPTLMAKSQSALDLLGLSSDCKDEVIANFLGGNDVIPGSQPAAHCYCGHQFGNFAGQLGDGATMYLGEVINPNTGMRWELQLKGAGKTPFSRTADGRKVLRSSVREFLCSEAMAALHVPTTRSGSCVTSDSTVQRDPFYNGNIINEKCTIITRIATNFFRFGSFEIFKAEDPNDPYDRPGPSAGNEDLKKQLLDHICEYYSEIVAANGGKGSSSAYEAVYHEVMLRTIDLVARWQTTGFVHGVLNTDNMSVMGLTIDYGPYGFMEQFDPEYVPNGSDGSARYSYKQQSGICKWNLQKFAQSLSPLLSAEAAQRCLAQYDELYETRYESLIAAKFGLPLTPSSRLSASDRGLIEEFFETMAATNTDFTDAFVALTMFAEERAASITSNDPPEQKQQQQQEKLVAQLASRAASPRNVIEALKRKKTIHRLSMPPAQIEQIWDILQVADEAQIAAMFNGAPADIVRQQIGDEKRKLDILKTALQVTKKLEMTRAETKRSEDKEKWNAWSARYCARIEECMLGGGGAAAAAGGDSEAVAMQKQQQQQQQLVADMQASNPSIVLRNWLAQDAIEMAEDRGDYSGIKTLLSILKDPFNPNFRSFKDNTSAAAATVASKESNSEAAAGDEVDLALVTKYTATPPDWADGLICTCSS